MSVVLLLLQLKRVSFGASDSSTSHGREKKNAQWISTRLADKKKSINYHSKRVAAICNIFYVQSPLPFKKGEIELQQLKLHV